MAGNVTPGDIFAGGGGAEFLNAEKKAELSRAKTPLGIVAAKPAYESQYGKRTSFTVVTKGETYELDLTHTDVRERQANAVLALLAGGAASVGPVYLVQAQSKKGNAMWVLDTEPGDGKVEPASVDGDDGIPF